jgi:alkylated DNA repair dioxygenase AlkB
MTLPLQGSLFGYGEKTAPRPIEPLVQRVCLDDDTWVDWCPAWLAGADRLFSELVAAVPWQAERRPMYDRVVDVPRLVAHYGESAELPVAAVDQARCALKSHYRGRLGEQLSTVGMCLYRDGRDSVAWHGDRVGRETNQETLVAIVSLGARRRLLLRPKGSGRSRRFEMEPGDLLVMGGMCQQKWEHSVPKTARPVAARISLQFRAAPRPAPEVRTRVWTRARVVSAGERKGALNE